MRTHYHRELGGLFERLAGICARDRAAMADAVRALLTADLELAEQVIDDCAAVAAARGEAERAATTLLALQAPVAGELRRVVAGVQLVEELTRMNALARHVAELARMRFPEYAVPERARPLVAAMGAAADRSAGAAVAVIGGADAAAALALRDGDEAMNALHRELLALVLAPDWREGTGAAVDLTLLGRYFERFADHAARVGARAHYIATGAPAGR